MRTSSRSIKAATMRKHMRSTVIYSLVLGLVALLTSEAGAQMNGVQIIPAQRSEPQARLDARIISMPKVTKKLEIIHNRSQLVKTRTRVRRMAIADPSIIDIAPFEEDEFAIIGTAIGSTTLTLWFEGDDNPLIYEITVIRDPNIEEQRRIDYGKLERKIAILFPNSKVYLIPLHEKLVVKGQARDPAEAARILQIVEGEFLDEFGDLYGPGSDAGQGGRRAGDREPFAREGTGLYSGFIVNMLQVPGEFQVMLHVTIAELNRSQLRRMGVDFAVLFADGRHLISSTLAGGLPTLTGIFENGDVSVLINALASNGTAKILSRPSLTTLSGYPAQFLAGGEFAVPTIVGVGGAQASTTSFRGFGTSMVVVPTVVDGDLIRLQIAPEFSQLDSNNAVQGIPGLNSRRVQTTVELREGQTIVLGGLLSRQVATEITRIPLLGEIPLIGPLLFNSKRSTEDEMELLVLVTPEIVRAMDPDEVPPMPGYYVTHPNDRELYRHAMSEGAPDLEVYQLAPYGNKVGYPNPVGFNVYNPSPATPQYGPIPQGNQPNGFPTPSPWTEQSSRYGGNSQQILPGEMPMQPGMMQPGMMQPGVMQPGVMQPGMMQPSPSYQQGPMNYPPMQPGYQQAPPAYQGSPGTPMTPEPSANSYRGGVPTASRPANTVPNYNQQLFQQPGGQTQQSRPVMPTGYSGQSYR
ncbi:MAG: pilus assembly protein N-terminal domain-containing protein [Planctomycetaceae bacterium]|nr:pilus assembly protein N-terminal domain-containing protein [Planctomycetaceae bacterium]